MAHGCQPRIVHKWAKYRTRFWYTNALFENQSALRVRNRKPIRAERVCRRESAQSVVEAQVVIKHHELASGKSQRRHELASTREAIRWVIIRKWTIVDSEWQGPVHAVHGSRHHDPRVAARLRISLRPCQVNLPTPVDGHGRKRCCTHFRSATDGSESSFIKKRRSRSRTARITRGQAYDLHGA